MNQWELISEITLEFLEILRKHFPENIIARNGSSGPTFDADLTDKNLHYNNTPYFYNGKLKFVHWTSVENLLSIINNREIRLYNLHSSSDQNEFKFAASALNIPNNQIDYSKNYLYTFSFCKSDDLSNTFLWKEYGKNYTGVAIEFEIINDPSLWKNFMFSQVYYELPKFLIDFVNDLKSLNIKYPGTETRIDLGRLISFHKESRFHKENEIRFSTYFPFESYEAYWKFCNNEFIFNKDRPRIVNYYGLSLWVDNTSAYIKSEIPEFNRQLKLEDDYFVHKPMIKINQIHFGKNCGINNNQFSQFREKLEEIIRYKLGYNLKLELNLFN